VLGIAGPDWLDRISRLRIGRSGGERAPHKPLLLLYALARLQRGESDELPFAVARGPLTDLLKEFGRPVIGTPRPDLPFFHLSNDDRLWELSEPVERRSHGEPNFARLREPGFFGRLTPEFTEALRAAPDLLAAAAHRILHAEFPLSLHADICDAVGLHLAPLRVLRESEVFVRSMTTRQTVFDAYEGACAMCGFTAQVGLKLVGLDIAHVRWLGYDGRDAIDNALLLCALHHRLFDRGAMSLDGDRRIMLSPQLADARPEAARFALDRLAGRSVATPRGGYSPVHHSSVDWHRKQVFRGGNPLRTRGAA
jgi:putative restriction endonuclease